MTVQGWAVKEVTNTHTQWAITQSSCGNLGALIKISQTPQYHTYVESLLKKKSQIHRNKEKKNDYQGWRVEKSWVFGKTIETFSYNMSKVSGAEVKHGV